VHPPLVVRATQAFLFKMRFFSVNSTISRAQGSLSFPSNRYAVLVGAMNPCPCGWCAALRKERGSPSRVHLYPGSSESLSETIVRAFVGPQCVASLRSTLSHNEGRVDRYPCGGAPGGLREAERLGTIPEWIAIGESYRQSSAPSAFRRTPERKGRLWSATQGPYRGSPGGAAAPAGRFRRWPVDDHQRRYT
jgi:hypothetical protein